MPDLADQTLKSIVSNGEFRAFDNIPVFDAHQEYDGKGNLIREFNKQRLQQIADFNNHRLAAGTPGYIGMGHTLRPQMNKDGIIVKPPETSQPKPIGIYGKLKVGPWGPLGKTCLIAEKFYVRDQIPMPDGTTLSAEEALKEFPQRSIEIWPDGLVSWVALLRIQSDRDLGTTMAPQFSAAQYERALENCPWNLIDSKLYFDKHGGRVARAAFSLDGVLRYSMEDSSMADPMIDAPDASADPNPAPAAPTHDLNQAEMAQADRVAAYYKSGQCKHYALPSPTNAALDESAPAVPPVKADNPPANVAAEGNEGKKIEQFARDGAPISERERNMLNRMLILEKSNDMIRYERELIRHQAEGVEIDVPTEMARGEKLTSEGRNSHLEVISKHYARAPIGREMINTWAPSMDHRANDTKEPNERELDVILHYQRKNACDYAKAFDATKGGKQAVA